MRGLEGKVALVTGGSRGIGAAICARLAEEGALVGVNYAGNTAAAQAVVDSIVQQGGRAMAIQADVSDSSACTELVKTVHTEFGSLDVVVNNAGITRDNLVMRMSDEHWRAVIDTDLSSAFYVTRAASKIMMKQRAGSIVNMSSVLGIVGNAGQANYSAAKAGLLGLTKATAKELASRNIRVNAVAPGFIETEMTGELPEAVRETARAQIALGVFGTPVDIASTVAFLASDEARYITGQVLAVDGGMTFV